ncbi:Sec-independent protein translocase subunit TatA/TatB [Halopenitus persicus]|uniref:Sec-independent protein translocase subunit TatA/TatB n=1 Tax=Halopenitus persicus TaxID=1048396 RepID=UPI000BBA7D3D|nr:twin-arginine translocase TatA/TatE family subunit [Halopenitus persicus]
MVPSIPLFGPLPVGPELLIILLVLVLLFGANKIPKLARSTGQAMGEFKKGREEIEEELQEMQGDEDEEDETTTAGSTGADASADETSTDSTSSDATDEDDATETETESSSK